jgi:spermidine synthase
VLGLGGGCVLKTLRNEFNFSGKITAVDIDPVIIQIAEKEFGIVSDDNTNIVCSDAFDYVKNDDKKFDLIIVDIFIDNEVPQKILSLEFWREIIKKTEKGGYIIFNTLCEPFTDILPIENKLKNSGFDCKIFRYVEKTNNVLIANYH